MSLLQPLTHPDPILNLTSIFCSQPLPFLSSLLFSLPLPSSPHSSIILFFAFCIPFTPSFSKHYLSTPPSHFPFTVTLIRSPFLYPPLPLTHSLLPFMFPLHVPSSTPCPLVHSPRSLHHPTLPLTRPEGVGKLDCGVQVGGEAWVGHGETSCWVV